MPIARQGLFEGKRGEPMSDNILIECEECADIIEKCNGCKKRFNIDDVVFCAQDAERHLCEECLGYIESSAIKHED